MILEFTGAGIVFASAVFLSLGLIRDHRTHLRELDAIYNMIAYIRDNIDHFMKPLPDIFQNYTNDCLESCGFLSDVRRTDLHQAWNGQTFSLSEETHTLLNDFFTRIGSGYRTEELRLCDYTLNRLNSILEKKRNESKNKLKLYKTVPMLVALSVILILI